MLLCILIFIITCSFSDNNTPLLCSLLGKMKESGFAGYTSALSALFADWTPDSRLDLARQLAAKDNTPSSGGVCVWAQALSHPGSGVVLVGDSGHGMWPSLGQGGNAALESVSGENDLHHCGIILYASLYSTNK